MYLTHTFAHRETLSRAQVWLTQLGFHPRQIKAPRSSVARLMIPVAPETLAAAQMLINAAESADPDAFPSFWDKAESTHGTRTDHAQHALFGGPSEPRTSSIGWHPLD